MTIQKPDIIQSSEAWLATVSDADVLLQEKSDGDWCQGGLQFGPHLLNAEKMKGAGSGIKYSTIDGCCPLKQPLPNSPRSPAPAKTINDLHHVVNDLIVCDGQDMRRLPFAERWAELQRIAQTFPAHVTLSETGQGVAFYRSVLERGGEGVVVKEWGASFGWGCYKVKRSQVFYCRVAGLDNMTGGVFLSDRDTGESRGKMPLRGGKFERVRGGSILKVVADSITAKGQLRDARPDADSSDSWLVQF